MKGRHSKHAKFNPMSNGGLNPTNVGGNAVRGRGGMLESNVSGHQHSGGAPSAGKGPASPSANKPAMEAGRAGRIRTEGQARGGPRQMSDEVGTPHK